MKQVVISGLGVVTAAGLGVADFGAALKAGRSGIRPIPEAVDLPIDSGALLVNFDFEAALTKIDLYPMRYTIEPEPSPGEHHSRFRLLY